MRMQHVVDRIALRAYDNLARAIRLGVIPEESDSWFRRMPEAMEALKSGSNIEDVDFFPNRRATRMAKVAISKILVPILIVTEVRLANSSDAEFMAEDEAALLRAGIEGCVVWMEHARGYLDGLEDAREHSRSKAAKARRRIGDNKRQKVRDLAAQHKGRVSKERAAFEIAEKIGASPGSIKKLLSEMFPGARWQQP